MDADSRVALAEIKGDVRLILSGQETINRDIRDLRETQHRHSNRIQTLEANEHHRKGERSGFIASGKLLHSLVGGGLLGIAALVLKVFGA